MDGILRGGRARMEQLPTGKPALAELIKALARAP
jgi:hypothetical protein